MGFSYHDNVVEFSPTREFSYGHVTGRNKVIGGSFTVVDCTISEHQDPDRVNHSGDVHPLAIGGDLAKLTFRAGRHKTKQVAQVWRNAVPANRNAHNRNPDELNFAFRGTLVLQFDYPAVTARFDNIWLAQGHRDGWTGKGGEVNDWWIGGPTAVHVGTDVLEIYGTNESDHSPVTVKVYRPDHWMGTSDPIQRLYCTVNGFE